MIAGTRSPTAKAAASQVGPTTSDLGSAKFIRATASTARSAGQRGSGARRSWMDVVVCPVLIWILLSLQARQDYFVFLSGLCELPNPKRLFFQSEGITWHGT